MSALDLWNLASQLKSTDYRWVDLTSHALVRDTPHWFGFKPFESTKLFDYLPGTPEECSRPCVASSIRLLRSTARMSTHRATFMLTAVPLERLNPSSLCIRSARSTKHEECAANPDSRPDRRGPQSLRMSTVAFPKDAFVAFRSDWSKLADLENKNEDGQPHYPGWDLDAIKWFVEERHIGAIGHEPADTDPAIVTTREDAYPYPGEQYILSVDRYRSRSWTI